MKKSRTEVKRSVYKILCAGFGGQGIMAMGKIIAMSALKQGYETSWFPSYGAEVRGGTAHCFVAMSKGKILSPYFEKADVLIALNQMSVDRFVSWVSERGVVIVNSSLGTWPTQKTGSLQVMNIPLTRMAVDLGWDRVANSVALGVFVAHAGVIDPDVARESIRDVLLHRPSLLEMNLKAFEQGLAWDGDSQT